MTSSTSINQVDQVKQHLGSILQYNEVLWTKILSTNQNQVDKIEIANAASDTRAKLNSAMDCAGYYSIYRDNDID